MSRTDKTKPLWVRYAEHAPQPVHDHRYGRCDLPPQSTKYDPGTRGRWTHPYTHLLGHTCCSGCHERPCTKERQAYVRASNRKQHYAGRRDARRLAAKYGDQSR